MKQMKETQNSILDTLTNTFTTSIARKDGGEVEIFQQTHGGQSCGKLSRDTYQDLPDATDLHNRVQGVTIRLEDLTQIRDRCRLHTLID